MLNWFGARIPNTIEETQQRLDKLRQAMEQILPFQMGMEAAAHAGAWPGCVLRRSSSASRLRLPGGPRVRLAWR